MFARLLKFKRAHRSTWVLGNLFLSARSRPMEMAKIPFCATANTSPTKNQTGFRKELLGLLNETGKTNKYSAETSRCCLPSFVGGITIDGLGILPLPVTPLVATAVKAACKVAPFGKGFETVVDTSVRQAYQIDSTKVTLSKALKQEVNGMVAECMEIMGVQGKVEAVFYKLLFYETGGHFDWHRDTVRGHNIKW